MRAHHVVHTYTPVMVSPTAQHVLYVAGCRPEAPESSVLTTGSLAIQAEGLLPNRRSILPNPRSGVNLERCSKGYAPKCVEKLSEKPRTPLLRSPAGDQMGGFRSIPPSVYQQNSRSERCSHPLSDSF